MFHTCCSRFIQSVTWPAIDPGTDPSPQTCYGGSGLYHSRCRRRSAGL